MKDESIYEIDHHINANSKNIDNVLEELFGLANQERVVVVFSDDTFPAAVSNYYKTHDKKVFILEGIVYAVDENFFRKVRELVPDGDEDECNIGNNEVRLGRKRFKKPMADLSKIVLVVIKLVIALLFAVVIHRAWISSNYIILIMTGLLTVSLTIAQFIDKE
jgi:hypothetical protein